VIRCSLALTIVLLALLSVAPVSAQTNDGSISGQVVNKTAGGGPVGGASVRLVTFGRQEAAPLGQRTTQSAPDGRFSFDQLDRDPNLIYVPFVRYADVNYRPDNLAQLSDQASLQLDVAVYESSTDDRAIQLDQLGLVLVGGDQGMLQFMEMGALSNTGDRTFVTANPQDQAAAHGIRLPLPTGALGIQMQSGFTNQELTSGIGAVQVTTPLVPGRHEFAMSFQLPYTGFAADLSMQLPYPTATYTVYAPDAGMRVNSAALADGGPMVLGDQSFRAYRASRVAGATVVPAQLSGLGSSSIADPTVLGILTLIVVLCIVGGGAVLINRRARPTAPRRRREKQADPVQERLDLVVQIAVLDERLAAGDITQMEHQVQRRLAKQRLRELTVIPNEG
jgi:hypothetical protein